MRVLHVLTQGAALRVSGERFEVWHERERIGAASAGTLEAVVVHGGVQLTAAAVSRLLAAAVPCVFLTQDGRLKGRLEPIGHPAARLRAAQALAAATPASRLKVARHIARNKLHSQVRVLRAIRSPLADDAARLRPRLLAAESLAELRGLEGWATRQYFAAWRERLKLFGWRRRQRPARDPLNALLSYGYALLMRPASTALAIVGLDPYQGFLHEATRAQPALLLDLIEEFRAPLIDLTVFDVYARLRPECAWWEAGNDGDVRLSLETRKLLIARFESRLLRRTRYRPTRRREQVGRMFELQARALARAIQAESALRPGW
jgi:CRISPR-associated protein Cas1